MILALILANKAELNRSGIIHIETDISNGGTASIRDDYTYNLFNRENRLKQFKSLPVPNLYCIKRKFCSVRLHVLEKKI